MFDKKSIEEQEAIKEIKREIKMTEEEMLHQIFSDAPVSKKNKAKYQPATLPVDSKERKAIPLLRGCLNYFPAALAGIAQTSQEGNDKHNPGKELYHSRKKSGDHGDCLIRHLMDVQDLLAAYDRGANITHETILTEVNQMAWRALALSQELHEKFGAPLAPGAKNE